MLATLLQVSRKTFRRLQQCCKSHEKLSGVCNSVASPTKNFLAFATVLQVPRKTFWRLQHRCKSHEKLSGVCNTFASLTKNFLAFATPLQIEKTTLGPLHQWCKSQKTTFWPLHRWCKHFQKRFGPSRDFRRGSLLASFLHRTRVTKVSARLRYEGRWPRYHSVVRRAYPDGFLRCTAPCEGSDNASGGGR